MLIHGDFSLSATAAIVAVFVLDILAAVREIIFIIDYAYASKSINNITFRL